MDNLAVCRVCLSPKMKMHVITSTHLHVLYEKLVETKLDCGDKWPTMLCYICYGQLQRCLGFMQMARRSDTVLTELYHSGVELTQDVLDMMENPTAHSYSISPIEYVDISNGATEKEDAERARHKIKMEIFDVHEQKNEIIDQEFDTGSPPDDIKEDPDGDVADTSMSIDIQSDPEDDLPLKSFKTEVKLERKKRSYKKRKKLDVREVLLTKEQQVQDVLSRATSLNYLNSPYRCALCYRGFVSQQAYDNHKDKHDERNGAFECEYCKLRYQTGRLLRTHTYTAHARYYQCNKCTHLSHTAYQASDHERWHEGHTYRCQLCSQSFIKRTSYLTHVRKRHPSEHVCDVCGERFVGRHGLLMHKSKAHRVKHEEPEDTSSPPERFCSLCNIQFASSRAWQRHILTSTKHADHAKLTKRCPICRCVLLTSLSEHFSEHARKLRIHRPAPALRSEVTRPLACGQCGETFPNKGKLSAHVRRVHLGVKYNKNIVCEVCAKKCTSNAALKYHQRTHTGERPYKCGSCTKRFADRNQLRIHTRTHTGEKPYSCEHCAKRFAQKPALNRHYRVHTGAKPYVCSLCSKAFSQSNSLKGHVKSVHLKMPSHRRRGQTNPDEPVVGKLSQKTSFDKTQELV